jgi:hypothetical protein
MALITKKNVTELVQLYFELRDKPETVEEKCQKMYEMNDGKLPMSDIYNIFWAIREYQYILTNKISMVNLQSKL